MGCKLYDGSMKGRGYHFVIDKSYDLGWNCKVVIREHMDPVTTAKPPTKASTRVTTHKPSRRCPEKGIDYPGHDIFGDSSRCSAYVANSWHECSEICRNEPQCLYWTWVKEGDQQCCLKDSNK